MKQIQKFFVILIFTVFAVKTAEAQAAAGYKPSGVYSINGQKTVGNNNVYYAPVKQWIEFLVATNPELPNEITVWCGAYLNGKYVSHDRSFFQPHAQRLQTNAAGYLKLQLEEAMAYYGGSLYDDQDTFNVVDLGAMKPFLLRNVAIEEVTWNVDTVYLGGERGDFRGREFVAHKNANGKYYVLTCNDGKKFILARVSCWNPVTKKEVLFLQQGKATTSGRSGPKIPTLTPNPNNGGDDRKALSFTDASGNTYNIYIQSSGGQGGSVVVGDISAKGGNSNNNNSVQGSGSGAGGTNPQQPAVIYGPGDNVPAPMPAQPRFTNQERYLVDNYTGVRHDKSAAYFASLQNTRPMQGLFNGWNEYLFGSGDWGYYTYGNQNYMVGGNWNNGQFIPNWNNCYQQGGNGWNMVGNVLGGFVAGVTYCGVARQQPQYGQGRCWSNNQQQIPRQQPQPQQRFYNNTNVQPTRRTGNPNMGGTIGAGNTGGGQNTGRPGMGYTIR